MYLVLSALISSPVFEYCIKIKIAYYVVCMPLRYHGNYLIHNRNGSYVDDSESI